MMLNVFKYSPSNKTISKSVKCGGLLRWTGGLSMDRNSSTSGGILSLKTIALPDSREFVKY